MAKTKPLTVQQFMARFPDDDACLEHLFRTRYGARFHCPKCGAEAKYYRIKKRRSYECEHCANQIYPTAGTPFEKTRTSLKDWFFVMFLFCASRNGVAAKEVQRQIGVTYKTAWRMCHEIRAYMGFVDGDQPLGGDHPGAPVVEADKAFIGGYDKIGQGDKMIVLGMAERGGQAKLEVIPSRGRRHVVPIIGKWIKPGSRVMTDSADAFGPLFSEYRHETVNHLKKEWVRGDVHTNSIEALWAGLKRSIAGTYIYVSPQHLPKYLAEFEFRHNLRKTPALMFELLLQAFPRGLAS